MNVAVIYCYPQLDLRLYFPLAKRFADTWKSNQSGYPCQLIVGCNGSPAREIDLAPFAGMACRSLVHSNFGWDIGLYRSVAETVPCDLLVCLGAGTQFHHPNWLARLVDAVAEHGPGLYGPWGVEYPNWHIRTTAFACPPDLLRAYPKPVTSDRRSRYQFEHGRESITAFTLDAGFPAVMVTMQGTFPYPDWPTHVPGRNDSILLDKQHA